MLFPDLEAGREEEGLQIGSFDKRKEGNGDAAEEVLTSPSPSAGSSRHAHDPTRLVFLVIAQQALFVFVFWRAHHTKLHGS